MKVKIGPYKDWIGPYQIAEKLLFWMDKADDRIDSLGEWLAKDKNGDKSRFSRFCDWFHGKKKRKIEIHIDEYDTWNMDHTLALITLPMLKQLRATKHGAPFVDDEDVPEHLRSTAAEPKENKWDTDSNHFKRWDWVMDEMIYAFTMKIGQSSDDEDDDWNTQIYMREPQGWNDAKLEEAKIIQDRISNGFRLFGKYYRALWD